MRGPTFSSESDSQLGKAKQYDPCNQLFDKLLKHFCNRRVFHSPFPPITFSRTAPSSLWFNSPAPSFPKVNTWDVKEGKTTYTLWIKEKKKMKNMKSSASAQIERCAFCYHGRPAIEVWTEAWTGCLSEASLHWIVFAARTTRRRRKKKSVLVQRNC